MAGNDAEPVLFGTVEPAIRVALYRADDAIRASGPDVDREADFSDDAGRR